MTDQPLLKELFAAIANSSDPAFGRLFNVMEEKVLRRFYNFTGNMDAAKDLRQQFFIRLWNHRNELVGIANPEGYMYEAIKNLALNYLRDVKTKDSALQRFKNQHSRTSANFTQEQLDEKQLKMKMDAIVATLPEVKQQVYYLRRDEGVPYEKIGALLGLTTQTAKAYFYQVVKSIRENLPNP